MNGDVHIKRQEVEGLATAVCQIAIRNLPTANSSRQEVHDWNNRSYFPEVLDTVTVRRIDAITQTHFNCPGATWVAELTTKDVERALLLKEGKYATYRRKCDEAWLLISADLGAMSTWFHFQSPTLSRSFKSSFDRVFILRHFGSKLSEIKLVT